MTAKEASIIGGNQAQELFRFCGVRLVFDPARRDEIQLCNAKGEVVGKIVNLGDPALRCRETLCGRKF